MKESWDSLIGGGWPAQEQETRLAGPGDESLKLYRLWEPKNRFYD